MAVIGTQESIEELLLLEEEILQEKRMATNNISWQTINYDNEGGGSGYIPEAEWKEKYSPNSQERSSI